MQSAHRRLQIFAPRGAADPREAATAAAHLANARASNAVDLRGRCLEKTSFAMRRNPRIESPDLGAATASPSRTRCKERRALEKKSPLTRRRSQCGAWSAAAHDRANLISRLWPAVAVLSQDQRVFAL